MQVNIGKGIELEVPSRTDELAANVADHVWMIGWRNILMDAHASVTREAVKNGSDLSDEETLTKVRDESRAVAEKKLAALLRGELRVVGERTRQTDPVMLEATRIAREKIVAGLRKTGNKLASYTKEQISGAVAKLIETDAEIMRDAKAIVAKRGKTEINLSDLGL